MNSHSHRKEAGRRRPEELSGRTEVNVEGEAEARGRRREELQTSNDIGGTVVYNAMLCVKYSYCLF